MKPPVSTHSWIDFAFDSRKLNPITWEAIGECVSKCMHLSETPMSPKLASQLHLIYLSKGVHATTAIEGNTLSEEEVRAIIEDKAPSIPSKQYLRREVENVLQACNSIRDAIQSGTASHFTSRMLNTYNFQVLEGLDLDREVVAGEARKHRVGVMRYSAPDWPHVPMLMERLCEKLNETIPPATEWPPIALAILKAIFAHLYIAWIHPFGDGNGRTARLLEMDILLRAGIPTPAAHLLSNHYNATRSEYYRRLEAASKARDASGFITYAICGFRDGLVEQLKEVNQYVIDTVWINYIYEEFRQDHTPTRRRRRDLLLAISRSDKSVPEKQVLASDSQLINAYAKKTTKTLTRDLNILVHDKWLLQETNSNGTFYRPNLATIESMCPMTR